MSEPNATTVGSRSVILKGIPVYYCSFPMNSTMPHNGKVDDCLNIFHQKRNEAEERGWICETERIRFEETRSTGYYNFTSHPHIGLLLVCQGRGGSP